METNQTEITPPESVKTKPPKRRIAKLTADEIDGLPNVDRTVVKKTEPEIAYFVCFDIPITGDVGTTVEAERIHKYACDLDARAKPNHIGSVSMISFVNGVCEVVLRLETTGKQSSHAAPVKQAFAQLGEFLGSVSLLTQGFEGTPSGWRAKVNGTTITGGHF